MAIIILMWQTRIVSALTGGSVAFGHGLLSPSVLIAVRVRVCATMLGKANHSLIQLLQPA